MARLPAWSAAPSGRHATLRPVAEAPRPAPRPGLWTGWLARRLAPLAAPRPPLAEPAR